MVVVIPLKPLSIATVPPGFKTTSAPDSNERTFALVSTPASSTLSAVVWFKFRLRSWMYFITEVSLSYEATVPLAVAATPLSVTGCCIPAPINKSKSLTVGAAFNFIEDNDENWDSVYKLEVPNLFGFLIIPTWAKCVSTGKSFVESSNLE